MVPDVHDDADASMQSLDSKGGLLQQHRRVQTTLPRIAAACARSVASIMGRADAVELVVRVWEAAAHTIMREIEIHPGVVMEIGLFEGYFMADSFEHLKMADIQFSTGFLETHGLDCRGGAVGVGGRYGWEDCGYPVGPPIPLSPPAVARHAGLDRDLVGSILPAMVYHVGEAMTHEESLVVDFLPLGRFHSHERLVSFVPAERAVQRSQLSSPAAGTVEAMLHAQQRTVPGSFRLDPRAPPSPSASTPPAAACSVRSSASSVAPVAVKHALSSSVGTWICANSPRHHNRISDCYASKAPRFHWPARDPAAAAELDELGSSARQGHVPGAATPQPRQGAPCRAPGTRAPAWGPGSAPPPRDRLEKAELPTNWTLTLEKKFGYLEFDDTVGIRTPRDRGPPGPSPWRRILGPQHMAASLPLGTRAPGHEDAAETRLQASPWLPRREAAATGVREP